MQRLVLLGRHDGQQRAVRGYARAHVRARTQRIAFDARIAVAGAQRARATASRPISAFAYRKTILLAIHIQHINNIYRIEE